jgi:hypothetical protein
MRHMCSLRQLFSSLVSHNKCCSIMSIKSFILPAPRINHVKKLINLLIIFVCQTMDKLKLTGLNLVSRLRHACTCHAIAYITKWPNLKWKTQPKQLLGSIPLAFALPGQTILHRRGGGDDEMP